MKKIDINAALAPLADFARDAAKEPVLVTRRGKLIAAVIPLQHDDLESLSLSTNPRFVELLATSRARLKKEGGIPLVEMYKRLNLRPRPGRPRKTGRKSAA
ncbi:MAG TPA: hypothetical protein VF669_03895 [Tepidisphaeraceae bacterium]|jgi:antitoxin (DNA-binding transcriptional repressor) of toxin-antitoxin stability system